MSAAKHAPGTAPLGGAVLEPSASLSSCRFFVRGVSPRLRAWRKAAGHTQPDAALLASMSPERWRLAEQSEIASGATLEAFEQVGVDLRGLKLIPFKRILAPPKKTSAALALAIAKARGES